MDKHSEIPQLVGETCDRCNGMGGFARGETAFDSCETCRGRGERLRWRCTVELLTGITCDGRLMPVVRYDDRPLIVYGCLSGHRFEYESIAGDWQWARVEDVAAAEAVA